MSRVRILEIWGLMRADGHAVSMSTVERAMRRRGLLQPIDYQGERREHAKARKAAFAEAPEGPNQVWQLDFSEYETTSGGIWRLAGVCDYFSKYEYGWHLAPGCTGADAIAAVRLAIAEAERLAGVALSDQLVDPGTGQIRRIKLVTDNGSAFKGAAFAAFIASRPELLHIRTRRRSPGQNGVRERASSGTRPDASREVACRRPAGGPARWRLDVAEGLLASLILLHETLETCSHVADVRKLIRLSVEGTGDRTTSWPAISC
jgi:transposase InsO family protein